MDSQSISSPGGPTSQTGVAVRERYSEVSISDGGTISDIGKALLSSGNTGEPCVVPLWNSHQGEVQAAKFVWDLIEKAKITITDLWAKGIEFWFIRKTGKETSCRKIGSVIVAETQCSKFIRQRNAEFVKYDLTTMAFIAYKEGADLDGVLVAPGQWEGESGYEIESRETANPNNFTTFVRISSPIISEDVSGQRFCLTGVTMSTFNASLSDDEASFFEHLIDSVTDINDFPKLVFVFDRDAKVGLLFESKDPLKASDMLDAEEIGRGNISINDKAGEISKSYTEGLRALFDQEFKELNDGDFICHRGDNTCMFACPSLGLYTHGYNIGRVEPVVRFFIDKIFEGIYANKITCSSQSQKKFFEDRESSWMINRSNFIEFKTIS